MSARRFFVAADGRLHAPWRILLFLVVTVLCYWLVAIALDPLFTAINRLVGEDIGSPLAPTLALLMSHAVMLRWLDRRGWSYVGLGAAAARPNVLARGWLLGAITILIPSLALIAIGWLAVRPSMQGSWWLAAAQVSLILVPAAFSEELFSRGYLFAVLREWIGWPITLALTSIGFGLLHLGNPGADVRSVMMVILAGIFLGAVLIATKSLYAAWMAHWAWNWIMAVPLHVAVSGLPLARPDYQVVDAGPDWITGGTWGPEGGAGGALGMLSGLAFLYWRSRRSGAIQTNMSRDDAPQG